jgi:hypothetical protein
MSFRGIRTVRRPARRQGPGGKTAAASVAVTVLAAAAAITLTGAGSASAFTPGEGTGKAWCPGYGGTNLGSYLDVYACQPKNKSAGKTPFDSYDGFQCTELANRFLYAATGNVLFDNQQGGNFVALAAAAYSLPDAQSGALGSVPAAGDIISMWGGRSKQRPNGGRTEVAIVTKVTATPSGWIITTLNQGAPSDTSARQGIDTITVSGGGKTWSTEYGYYTSFDWLELGKQGGGGGSQGGTGNGNGGGSGGNGSSSATWSAAEAPLRGSGQTGQLLAVACSSGSDCTAVGVSNGTALLVYRASGRWQAVTVPVPSSSASGARLTAITCPSGSACLAAGHYGSGGRQQGLLLFGHDTSWTATRAPLPASAAVSPAVLLPAVACPAAAACVAAGQFTASSGSTYGLLLTGHDSSWSAYRAPLPADAAARPQAQISSVSCPAAGDCVAAGSYTDAKGNRQGMLLTGWGSSWTALRSPLPASANVPGAALSAISCQAAAACVAVGSFSAQQQGMVLTGWGTSWTARQAPLPAGAAADPATSFRQITCMPAGGCVAVGSYADSGGSTNGLLLSGQGSSWSALAAALPAGAAGRQGVPGAQLSSVACASPYRCAAVGQYTDMAGDARLLLLTGHATSWTASRAPLPTNNQTVGSQAQGSVGPPDLAAAACPSATWCVAVGTYPARKPGMEGLLVAGPA